MLSNKMPCHISDGPADPDMLAKEHDGEQCPWCGENTLYHTKTVQWTKTKAFDEFECDCGYECRSPDYTRYGA